MSVAGNARPCHALIVFCALAIGVSPLSAGAVVYKLLYSPASLADRGSYPSALLEGAPGLFYGLSSRGTSEFGPSIFKLSRAGEFRVVYSLDPFTQSHALVHAANGLLYGAGFVSRDSSRFYFSIEPSGQNLRKYSMPGEWGSGWQLAVQPPDGLADIVASNPEGGDRVYALARIRENGETAIVHEFVGGENLPAGAGLARGADGTVYGIAAISAGARSGFMFGFTPGPGFSRVASLPAIPAAGTFPIAVAADGNLYGVLSAGGDNHTGEIYRAIKSGQFERLASFPATGMKDPQTLMEASDGNLYGSTNNTYIFGYSLKTRTLTTVFHLDPEGSQGLCPCRIIEGMDGMLYAVAPFGGRYPGTGAVFSLDLGLPRPKPVVSRIYPASGSAGQTVLLWGDFLLGATSVIFNGTPAGHFTVTSAQSIRVDVPAGASTGTVTVRTENGSSATKSQFYVTTGVDRHKTHGR